VAGEWQNAEWGDIVALEYGKSLRNYRSDYGSYPVYGTNGRIGWYEESLCKHPGVIVGRKGAYRGIHYSREPFFVIDTAFYIEPKKKMDLKWVYYCLLTYDINGMDSGSAIPSTSRDAFYRLTVRVPPFPEQQAIAHILGTLDDKIELNRQMNKTLEDIARALFESWFVRFDPVKRNMARKRRGQPSPSAPLPKAEGLSNESMVERASFPSTPGRRVGDEGVVERHAFDHLFPDQLVDSELGKIPEGWEVGILGDVVTNIAERVKPSVYTQSRPYVPIECISPRTICLWEYQHGLNARSSLIEFKKGDIIFGAMRPYFHKVCIAPFDGTSRTTAFILRPNQSELAFAAFAISRDDTIEYATAHSEGSTIPYAKWAGSLQDMKIIIPPKDVRQAFHKSAWPLIERMMANVSVNTMLGGLRDTLLPKLISGELRVPDAERFLKEKGLC
jgi:type I restriction enzyme S subunit